MGTSAQLFKGNNINSVYTIFIQIEIYNTLIYLLQIKHSLKKSELAEKLGNAYFSLKAEQLTSTGRRVHSVCMHSLKADQLTSTGRRVHSVCMQW